MCVCVCVLPQQRGGGAFRLPQPRGYSYYGRAVTEGMEEEGRERRGGKGDSEEGGETAETLQSWLWPNCQGRHVEE